MMIQMIQRRTLVLINCVEENTFLVKRECRCIYNFRMYSLVYFIYCISVYPNVPIGRFINIIKSCIVNEDKPLL